MIRQFTLAILLLTLATPANAKLNLCNRTSYVTDIAAGIKRGAAVSTRGWFRIDPGQSRCVIDEEPHNEGLVYVHARTLPFYGKPPEPGCAHGKFCTGDQTFAIANPHGCSSPVPFTTIKPTDADKGPSTVLAEKAEYDYTQARLAGI